MRKGGLPRLAWITLIAGLVLLVASVVAGIAHVASQVVTALGVVGFVLAAIVTSIVRVRAGGAGADG
jgi:hypothetical protein